MQVDKALDGGEKAVAQAAFMRAASAGRNQIDIAFTHRMAVFGEGHAPLRALAFGKAVMRGIGKAFAFKHRNHQVSVERLHQVVMQPAFVNPGLGFLGLFIDQRDSDARHQHGLAAQQVRQLVHGQRRSFKVFRIGPSAHRRAALAVSFTSGSDLQRFNDIATREDQPRRLAVAPRRHFHALGQRIGHADTDAVQTARKAVGTARTLVELATGMQACEDQFDHGRVFFRVHAKRNAAAIVFNADRAVCVQSHLDLFAVPGQGFVGRVVEHLLQDVQGVVGAGVHARPLLDRLKALEHADGTFGIVGG